MTKILFLEDSADDMELMLHELREASMSCTAKRVDKKKEFTQVVDEFQPHIILADYSLPLFTGMEAFRMLKRKRLNIPFILVTGALSEQVALECVKEGVDDFILKSSFKRLPAAINNAIEKKQAENEKERMGWALKKSHRDLQKLAEQLQVMREEERLIIARDLHDELGQVLTGLKIDISMLWKGIASGKLKDTPTIDTEFSNIIGLVNQITQSVKRIASGLRPEILDELGIVEAIRWQCQEFEARHKIPCKTHLNIEFLDVERNFAIALFRIVQEALTNVTRHAEATVVKVRLAILDETLHLSIEDNGKGISEEAMTDSGALGLVGLRERARFLDGKVSISGESGKGTKVLLTVPIKQPYAIEQN
jgi:signal transduction histidine kinase